MACRRERILKAVKLVIACEATEPWEIREAIRQARGVKPPGAAAPAAVSAEADAPLPHAAAVLQKIAGKARQ